MKKVLNKILEAVFVIFLIITVVTSAYLIYDVMDHFNIGVDGS